MDKRILKGIFGMKFNVFRSLELGYSDVAPAVIFLVFKDYTNIITIKENSYLLEL